MNGRSSAVVFDYGQHPHWCVHCLDDILRWVDKRRREGS